MRSYRGRMGFIASGWLGRSGLGRKLSTRRRQLDFEGFREPELEGLPDSELARLRYFRQAHSRKFEAHVMSMSLPHTRTETEPIDIEDLPPKRKKLRRGVQVEVDITELASTGEGVAKLDTGMVIFVERGHPGSRVVAEVFNSRKDHAYAKVISVVNPSENTIKPICKHYPTCRGCKFQDLKYSAQMYEKHKQVENLFRQYKDIPVLPIIGSDSPFQYRNKMEFTYGTKRYHPDGPPAERPAGDEFILGMNAPRAWDKVIELDECHLMPEPGTEILNLARDLTRETKFPAYDNYAHEGFFRNLVLRFASNGNGEMEVMVNIVTSFTDADQMLRPLAEKLVSKFPCIVSVMHSMTTSKGGSTVAEKEVLLYGRAYIEQQLRGLVFRISSSSFFQPNPGTAEKLYKVIEDFAELTPELTVLDLFCGTGTIGLSLAGSCKHVHGLELVEAAVHDAENNATRNGIHNATFKQENLDLTKISPHELDLPKSDVIVLDPPRAGLHPRLVKWLKLTLPKRIVYASCNPSTQVRDVNRLCEDDGPYRLTKIQPVDQFPNTPHCECVVALELREDYKQPSEFYV